mgnify:CR=1 FL=1
MDIFNGMGGLIVFAPIRASIGKLFKKISDNFQNIISALNLFFFLPDLFCQSILYDGLLNKSAENPLEVATVQFKKNPGPLTVILNRVARY